MVPPSAYFHPGQKIYFHHIPCTGGAELHSVIQVVYSGAIGTIYPKDPAASVAATSDALAPETKEQFVLSHADLLGPLPDHVQVVTFYRDPVERMLSQHFFGCREARAAGKAEPAIPPRDAWPDLAVAGNNRYLRTACRLVGKAVFPETPVNQNILNMACAMIDRGYAWIGITERFADSLRLLAHTLRWPTLPRSLPQDHVKSGRPGTAELDPETVAWARHATHFDQMLYARALARFEQELMGVGRP